MLLWYWCLVCRSQGEESRIPCMCLVCGQVVCSQSFCCQSELESQQVGACTAHAHCCGAGWLATNNFLCINKHYKQDVSTACKHYIMLLFKIQCPTLNFVIFTLDSFRNMLLNIEGWKYFYQFVSGTGVFLKVKDCKILMFSGRGKGCYVSAPYLDQYGETDQGLKRGNPLKLCQERYWFYQNMLIPFLPFPNYLNY